MTPLSDAAVSNWYYGGLSKARELRAARDMPH
jgi:hypothetical protein